MMASHKPGKITSSTVSRLLTGKGDKLLKGGRTFARELARERYGVVDTDDYTNAAMEWGDRYEVEALARYEAETFTEVHGMQHLFEDEWLSCSVDGLVGEDGITEVKCHYNTQKHMDNLLYDAWLKDYEEQCRFQMMLSERSWCDLISYDPRWPEPKDLHWVRIERDKEWEAFCMDRIAQAEEIIEDTLTKLNDL